MPRPTQESGPLLHLLLYVSVAIILFLSAFNLEGHLKPKKVLGTKIESETTAEKREFWEKFLLNNPNYIPGWIEVGSSDKVKQIDPNYLPLP